MIKIKNTEEEVLSQIKRITMEFFTQPESDNALFRFCKIITRFNQLVNNNSSDEVFDSMQDLYSKIGIIRMLEDKNKELIISKLEKLAEQQVERAFFESNSYAYARTRFITGLIYHINNNDLNNNFNLVNRENKNDPNI